MVWMNALSVPGGAFGMSAGYIDVIESLHERGVPFIHDDTRPEFATVAAMWITDPGVHETTHVVTLFAALAP